MLRSRLVLSLLFVISPGFVPSQDEAKDALMADVAALKPAPLELSSETDAWSVRVIRTGGIAGTTLDVTVTSQGKLKCLSTTQTVCTEAIRTDVLEPTRLLATSETITERKSTLSTTCRDCFVTRITVRRREAGGKVKTYFAYWDDVTAISAPFDLVRLATAVVSLAE